MKRFLSSKALCLLVALVCSLALSIITLAPPTIPSDWARLDASSVYLPQHMDYRWSSYTVQVALWLVMIGVLWWGFRNSDAKSPTGTRHVSSLPKSFPIIILIITLLGFGLRLYSLNRLPLIVDEIGFAAHASDILHGQQVPIFAPGHNANPSVYSWLVAGAMALLGQNAFAIRLIPLVFGTLSVPAAYLLGRMWWSKRLGLLAAAFLATYPAHVFYSRMSLYNIVDPFFAFLALAFLARGMHPHPPPPSPLHREGESEKRSSQRYLVMAGIAAGIAQYFYHGSRMLPLLMLIYVVVSLYGKTLTQSHREASHRREAAKTQRFYYSLRAFASLRLCVESFWLFAAFALVSLPRYVPLLFGHLPITGNINIMRLPLDLADNTVRAALAWVGQADISPFWLSDQPLLMLPALLAFLFGVWFCWRNWRDPRSLVLLISIPLTTIFGGAIWTAAPLYVRYMTAVPMIALLVAIGLSAISRQSSALQTGENLPEYKGVKRDYLLYIMAGTICISGIYVSLFAHPQQAYERITLGHWEEDALARQAAELPSGTAAVFIVSPDFGGKSPDPRTLQVMSIAHYVAAYGERRVVIINQHDAPLLQKQLRRLDDKPYKIIQLP